MSEASTGETTPEVADDGNATAPQDIAETGKSTRFNSETGRKAREERTRKEREAAARAERDAELDKLTTRARLAVGLAGELTSEKLRDVLAGLLTLATSASSEHARVQASKLVLELAARAVEDDGGAEPPDGKTWEELTPEQRAAAMAALDRFILEQASLPEASDPADDPPGT